MGWWGGKGGEVKPSHVPCASASEQIKRKTKPCWLLGGFSGEAGETTITIGDEAVASDSPVGKKQASQKSENTRC